MSSATIPVIFATSFAVGFSGAITPGPLLVFTIRESVRRGFVAGPLVATGHALLEMAVMAGLAIGVARFLEKGVASFAIATLGGLFLLWMGWGMVRNPSGHVLPQGNPGGGVPVEKSRPDMAILGGALVSISNPYWSLWWATIGLEYIVWATGLGTTGIVSFYTGHILADLAWYSLVAFAVASGRRVMTPGAYRVLIAVCGLFLLALGGYFIVSGVDFLRDFLG